ncbi:hypothetical protein UA70_15940, partial [Raoultella planticola]
MAKDRQNAERRVDKSAPATVRFFVRDPAPLSHSTGPPASKRQRAAKVVSMTVRNREWLLIKQT